MLYAYAKNIESHILCNDFITIRDLVKIVGHESVLVILVFLSILNIILSPLPINSFILGIPLFLFSVFYLFDWDIKKADFSLLDKRLSCVSWRKYTSKLTPYLFKFDKLSSARWHQILRIQNRFMSGFLLSFLALIVFLPIPFANVPGSIGMILVCLGLLQRDGLFVFLGYMVFLLHVFAILFFDHIISLLN